MRNVTRDEAIDAAAAYFDGGGFLEDLRRRVAYRTESGVAERREDLRAYLEEELVPAARGLGATAGMAAAPPTTRASTPSTSPPWTMSCAPAAGGSAST
jgi:plasmid stability protein